MNLTFNFKLTPALFIILTFFFLPINKTATTFSLILLTINWLFIVEKKNFIKNIISNIKVFPLILFYLIYVLCLINTSNFVFGRMDLEIKLSLLLVPLIFSSLKSDYFTSNRLKNIFYAYIIGNVVYFLICIITAIVMFIKTGNYCFFYYNQLSVFHHPSYSSMFSVFAICIAFFLIIKRNKMQIMRLELILLFISIAPMLLFCLLLSSKAGVVSLFFAFLFFIIEYIFIEKQMYKGLIIGFIWVILIFGTIKLLPNTISRIKNASSTVTSIVNNNTLNAQALDGTTVRLLIWKTSLSLVSKNIFGYGTGDVKDVLVEEYKIRKMSAAVEYRYNCHNQYLQTTIACGIIGFIILSYVLVYLFIIALKNNFLLPAVFILILSFNMMVESMLETQDGVIFFALFWTLFVSIIKKNKTFIIDRSV